MPRGLAEEEEGQVSLAAARSPPAGSVPSLSPLLPPTRFGVRAPTPVLSRSRGYAWEDAAGLPAGARSRLTGAAGAAERGSGQSGAQGRAEQEQRGAESRAGLRTEQSRAGLRAEQSGAQSRAELDSEQSWAQRTATARQATDRSRTLLLLFLRSGSPSGCRGASRRGSSRSLPGKLQPLAGQYPSSALSGRPGERKWFFANHQDGEDHETRQH